MTTFLYMSGVGSYLQLPSMVIRKIVIDGFFPKQSADFKMLIDCRPGMNIGYVYARLDGSTTSAGANFTVTNYARDTRRVVEFYGQNNLDGTSNFTDNVTIFASNGFAENFMGFLYDIKCYNNAGTLIAHYNMNTGTVQDQTGNGNHATLVNGVWLDDTKTYSLSMDGVDDRITFPSITVTEFVMDFKPRPQTFEQYINFNTVNIPINRNGSNNADQINANYSAVYVDGVQATTDTAFIKVNTRQILRGVLTNPTTSSIIIYWNGASSYMEGDLYSLKLYNGATLQAEYDFTKGHPIDLTGNGNHGTLTGGTYIDETKYFLQMDGIDDYLKTPSITFNKVIMDAEFALKTNTNHYFFDARNGFTNGYFIRSSGNVNNWGSSISGIKKDGVALVSGQNTIPSNTRMQLEITMASTGTDDVSILSMAADTEFMPGKLYNIKFYNGATLVAYYDMSLGHVQDLSGNGKHATLVGGTWVADTTNYYLSMDGIDDVLQLPSMTASSVVIDCYINSSQNDTRDALFDTRSGGTAFIDIGFTNMRFKINGGAEKLSNTDIPKDSRNVLDIRTTFSSVTTWTDNTTVFAKNDGTTPLAGKIYNVKLYNDTTLVAHYDMTKGNVQDISGNGNHATLIGGTWVAPTQSTKDFKVWNGSAFVSVPLANIKRWNGSAFIGVSSVKQWDGSAWQTIK